MAKMEVPKAPARRRNGRSVIERGKSYERELTAYFNTRIPGLTVYRSAATQNIADRSIGFADLVGLPGLAPEAKRTNVLRLEEALAQAIRNAAPGEVPIVISRGDRRPTGDSRVVLRLDDFVPIYTSWLRARGDIA